MSADRNLLFGILALQLDFISRDQLIAAMNTWVLDKSKPMGDVLRDSGALGAERLQLLTALVAEHLRQHDNDPQLSLAALSSVESTLQQQLAELPDADLQGTLMQIGRARSATSPDAGVSIPVGSLVEGPMSGRYRILKPHAKGGLGEVFVAQDIELGRRVALKEIQAQHAHDPQCRGRFVLEAEVTGGLEHPGIVPIYGLGHYADGRPYYAMRFIKGDNLRTAIRKFHEESKGAPKFDSIQFRQLLGRFIDVCQAVAYAHSRGVLHRDLKPGNVMLGPYGETLVVDWGLAKVVGRSSDDSSNAETDVTLIVQSSTNSSATAAGQVLGTPAYMPPEQAAGEWDQLGPASDVYSLGATLYELLTSKAPFEARMPEVITADVRRGRFLAPRRIVPTVPRALEAVCLKAMALKPADRYPSATELAREIERWQADEPVTALRETIGAQSRRWVRKHARLATGVAAALIVSVIGFGALAWQREQARASIEKKEAETVKERDRADEEKRIAQAERDRALVARKRTREALDTMVSKEMVDRLGSQKELSAGQREFLQKALGYYREFAQDSATEEEGRQLVADANYRIAFLLTNLGQRPEAERSYRAALAIREKLAADFPAVPAYRHSLARIHNNLAVLLADLGQRPEAEKAHRAALAIRDKLAADFPAVPVYRQDLAASHDGLATLLVDLGQRPEAEKAYRAALAIREKLAGDFPAVPDYRQDLAASQNSLAILLVALGQRPEAEKSYRAALAIYEKLAADYPAVSAYRQALAASHNNLAILLGDLGQRPEAEKSYRAALAIYEKLAVDYPAVPAYRQALAGNHNNLANMLVELGQHPEAEKSYRAALANYEKLVADFPTVPLYRQELAGRHNSLAFLLHALGQGPEAEKSCRTALAIQDKLAADFPAVPAYRQELARSHSGLGILLGDVGKRQEAEKAFRAALAIFEKLAADYPTMPAFRQELAGSHSGLANLLLFDLGRRPEAEKSYRAALAIREKLAADFPAVPAYRLELAGGHYNLACLLDALGQRPEAEKSCRTALAIQDKLAADFPAVPTYRQELANSHSGLGILLFDLGQRLEAEKSFRAARAIREKLVADFPAVPAYRDELADLLWQWADVPLAEKK